MEYIESDEEVQSIVQKAIENPRLYVIKPQKEGGGNNFYGNSVKEMLVKASQSDEARENIKQYLIMERINPPEIRAWMIRGGQVIQAPATL